MEIMAQGQEQDNCNLIINFLPLSFTETDLESLFSSVGDIVSLKLIRDKNNHFPISHLNTNIVGGQSLGYGFIRFKTKEEAMKAIQQFNGFKIQDKTLKVALARPSSEQQKPANLYISGLPKSIKDSEFESLFRQFGEITTFKLFRQENNEKLNAIGFVLYNDRNAADKAIKALDGKQLENNTIHVKYSQTPSQKNQNHSQMAPIPINHPMNQPVIIPGTATSGAWTIFVYNLAPETQEIDLWRLFGPLGKVQNIKIIKDMATNITKGYAFVTMTHYEEALLSIRALNGFQLLNRVLQVSFKTNNDRKRRLTQ